MRPIRPLLVVLLVTTLAAAAAIPASGQPASGTVVLYTSEEFRDRGHHFIAGADLPRSWKTAAMPNPLFSGSVFVTLASMMR